MTLKSFDFLCPTGHTTDFFDWEHQSPQTITCRCGLPAQRVWLHAPGMQPDNLWAGVNTEIGYVTSKSQLRDIMVARGERFWEPGVENDAKKAKENQKVVDQAIRRAQIEDAWADFEHPGHKLNPPARTNLNENPNEPAEIKMIDESEDTLYAGGN